MAAAHGARVGDAPNHWRETRAAAEPSMSPNNSHGCNANWLLHKSSKASGKFFEDFNLTLMVLSLAKFSPKRSKILVNCLSTSTFFFVPCVQHLKYVSKTTRQTKLNLKNSQTVWKEKI